MAQLRAAHRDYKRLIISYWDYQEVEASLAALEALGPEAFARTPLVRALTTAFIIGYARPHSGNKGSKDVSPRLPKSAIAGFPASVRDLHHHLLKLRNKEFAHSAPSEAEVHVTVSSNPERIPTPTLRVPRAPLTRGQLRLARRLLGAWDQWFTQQLFAYNGVFQPGERF